MVASFVSSIRTVVLPVTSRRQRVVRVVARVLHFSAALLQSWEELLLRFDRGLRGGQGWATSRLGRTDSSVDIFVKRRRDWENRIAQVNPMVAQRRPGRDVFQHGIVIGHEGWVATL